jgi:hypothetical protein
LPLYSWLSLSRIPWDLGKNSSQPNHTSGIFVAPLESNYGWLEFFPRSHGIRDNESQLYKGKIKTISLDPKNSSLKVATIDNRKDYLQTWGEFFFFIIIIIIFLIKTGIQDFLLDIYSAYNNFCMNSHFKTGIFWIQWYRFDFAFILVPKFASSLFDCRSFPIWNLKLKELSWFCWSCKWYTLLHWKGKCTECIVIDCYSCKLNTNFNRVSRLWKLGHGNIIISCWHVYYIIEPKIVDP